MQIVTMCESFVGMILCADEGETINRAPSFNIYISDSNMNSQEPWKT